MDDNALLAIHKLSVEKGKLIRGQAEALEMLETALAALVRGKADVALERLEFVVSSLRKSLEKCDVL